MRQLLVRMNMSLDGFIEGPRGAMNWFAGGDEHWRALFSWLEGVDTFVLGRTMYPGYAEHWSRALTSPTATDQERAFARLAQQTPHVVVSTTLQSADYGQTSIVRDLGALAQLKERPGKDLMVWGGATLVTALHQAGLVDELVLLVQPVFLGGGKALFRDVAEPQRFVLAGTRTFGTGVVELRYRPRR